MKPDVVDGLLRAAFPDGRWRLKDLTGTEDHYDLRIASQRFAGLSPLAQHRLVYVALGDALERNKPAPDKHSQPIHALALSTMPLSDWTDEP